MAAEPAWVADGLVSEGVAHAATDTSSIRLFVGDAKVEIIETEPLDPTEAAGWATQARARPGESSQN